MKPPAFIYHAPRTVEEALSLMEQYEGTAKFLAGGQSLMPALNFRLAYPGALIDLNNIKSLQDAAIAPDGSMIVGAMVRHRFFELDSGVHKHWPLLSHAIRSVAHVQIRNRGTIGGSLAHADPSAEWPALCLACDAEMVLRNGHGERRVPSSEFSKGLFSTAIDDNELLTHIHFPAYASSVYWGFQEVSRRRGDFAIVGVICVLNLEEGGHCAGARIVVFGATDRPELVSKAADCLVNQTVTPELVQEAASIASRSVQCRADQQASARYRQSLVNTLTARALNQALRGGERG